MKVYVYRTTYDKLAQHHERIAEVGDTVIGQHYVGGRDWVLICRKGEPTLADLTPGELEKVITRAVTSAVKPLVVGR